MARSAYGVLTAQKFQGQQTQRGRGREEPIQSVHGKECWKHVFLASNFHSLRLNAINSVGVPLIRKYAGFLPKVLPLRVNVRQDRRLICHEMSSPPAPPPHPIYVGVSFLRTKECLVVRFMQRCSDKSMGRRGGWQGKEMLLLGQLGICM